MECPLWVHGIIYILYIITLNVIHHSDVIYHMYVFMGFCYFTTCYKEVQPYLDKQGQIASLIMPWPLRSPGHFQEWYEPGDNHDYMIIIVDKFHIQYHANIKEFNKIQIHINS